MQSHCLRLICSARCGGAIYISLKVPMIKFAVHFCDLETIGIWIISVKSIWTSDPAAFASSDLRSAMSRALANYRGHQQQKQTPAPSKLISREEQSQVAHMHANAVLSRPAKFWDALFNSEWYAHLPRRWLFLWDKPFSMLIVDCDAGISENWHRRALSGSSFEEIPGAHCNSFYTFLMPFRWDLFIRRWKKYAPLFVYPFIQPPASLLFRYLLRAWIGLSSAGRRLINYALNRFVVRKGILLEFPP